MTKVNCLNPISELGTGLFNNNYEMTDNFADADVALVRSAAMHDLDLPESLCNCKSGAGVNNTHWINVQIRVLLYLTHQVQMLTE